MSRAQKRMWHRMYHKKRFKTVFEAREFLIDKCGSHCTLNGVVQPISAISTKDVCDLLFTFFGARIMVPQTKKPPSGPPPGLQIGAHFVQVVETDKRLVEKQLLCDICGGERWVCENHPKIAWGGGSACCGGAGMQCECRKVGT